MMKYQKEAILIAFLKEKERYKRLAEYIVHLIRDDPSSPKESLHTIVYRIKDELRLIEKIDIQNSRLEADEEPISEKNYQAKVGDLLGVRIICLRLSDIVKIESYLELLSEEKILCFVKGPDKKRSFLLPVGPGDAISGGIERRYSGYSSIHYQVQLGENTDAPLGLKKLQLELQLRTILEEAWGEIDHKYRYVRSRRGVEIPDYIQRGFYNLSVSLQVAALQAEDLCLLAETCSEIKTGFTPDKETAPLQNAIGARIEDESKPSENSAWPDLEEQLEEILGVHLTARTLRYVERRLEQIGFSENPRSILQKVLTDDRMREFRAIFSHTMDRKPFTDEKERNIDVVNALNYAIFDELQGKKVAQEGLRTVLKWRKKRNNNDPANEL
jgi:ppGpp synthetase/RelA/SpoT-type nucleotidyltranferase